MFPRSCLAPALTLAALVLAQSACTAPDAEPAPSAMTAEAEDAVRAVLGAQVAAWNAGSLRGFMEGYVESEALRFASGGNVRTGWQTTLDSYERGYPDRAAMGTLRFDSLDVRLLSPDWSLAFGRWHLERAGDAPNGLFTLLLEKRPEGWRIVHDHTSSSTSPSSSD